MRYKPVQERLKDRMNSLPWTPSLVDQSSIIEHSLSAGEECFLKTWDNTPNTCLKFFIPQTPVPLIQLWVSLFTVLKRHICNWIFYTLPSPILIVIHKMMTKSIDGLKNLYSKSRGRTSYQSSHSHTALYQWWLSLFAQFFVYNKHAFVSGCTDSTSFGIKASCCLWVQGPTIV